MHNNIKLKFAISCFVLFLVVISPAIIAQPNNLDRKFKTDLANNKSIHIKQIQHA